MKLTIVVSSGCSGKLCTLIQWLNGYSRLKALDLWLLNTTLKFLTSGIVQYGTHTVLV